MASDILGLLSALKDWHKALMKLNQNGAAAKARGDQVESARQQVLAHLTAESTAEAIDELIQRAIAPDGASPESIRQTLQANPESVISVELKTMRPLPVSRKELKTIIDSFLKISDAEKPVANSEELKEYFAQLSLAISHAYETSKHLSRKPKKRRRRDITLGALHTTVGLGLMVGNTQLASDVSNYSYLIGGNALIAAMKHFVGQLETAANEP